MYIEHHSETGLTGTFGIRPRLKRVARRVLIGCLILLPTTMTVLAQAPTPPPQAAGYNLVFSVNFTGPVGTPAYQPINLSTSSSGTNYTWYPEGSSSASNIFFTTYTPPGGSPGQALELNWVNGGRGSLTGFETKNSSSSYYRGFHYGYFEASFAWDPVGGAWPAFWMDGYPATGGPSGKEYGELDIFEGQCCGNGTWGYYIGPNVYYGTVHDWVGSTDVDNNNCCNYFNMPDGTDVSQFHTYGVLWVPGEVTWYFDNQPMGSYPTMPIYDTDLTQLYYLILGSQEGCNWSGGNKTCGTPSNIWMNIQWVRVWQLPGGIQN